MAQSSGYHPTTDTTFQYSFYWVPFIFIGSTLILYRTDSGGGGADQAGQALASGHYETLAAQGKFVLLIRKKT